METLQLKKWERWTGGTLFCSEMGVCGNVLQIKIPFLALSDSKQL